MKKVVFLVALMSTGAFAQSLQSVASMATSAQRDATAAKVMAIDVKGKVELLDRTVKQASSDASTAIETVNYLKDTVVKKATEDNTKALERIEHIRSDVSEAKNIATGASNVATSSVQIAVDALGAAHESSQIAQNASEQANLAILATSAENKRALVAEDLLNKKIDSAVNQLNTRIDQVDASAKAGTAAALAVAGLVTPPAGKSGIAVSTGMYAGQTAVALGLTHSFNRSVSAKVAITKNNFYTGASTSVGYSW